MPTDLPHPAPAGLCTLSRRLQRSAASGEPACHIQPQRGFVPSAGGFSAAEPPADTAFKASIEQDWSGTAKADGSSDHAEKQRRPSFCPPSAYVPPALQRA